MIEAGFNGLDAHMAARFDQRREVAFHMRAPARAFDETNNAWSLRIDRGDTIGCKYLMIAAGSLSSRTPLGSPGCTNSKAAGYRPALVRTSRSTWRASAFLCSTPDHLDLAAEGIASIGVTIAMPTVIRTNIMSPEQASLAELALAWGDRFARCTVRDGRDDAQSCRQRHRDGA